MPLRTPEETFLQKLKNYDRLLDVVWIEKDELGRLVQRWRIIRQGADGRPRHIMYVQDPETGEYRHLDDRVLQKLYACDSHRFADVDDLLRAFDAAEDDLPLRKAIRDTHDRRYMAGCEELADRLAYALKKDNTVSEMGHEKELSRALKQIDAGHEVQAAYDKGKGVIVLDKELGCPVVVPGTT